ncbi:MAG: anti-sigma factor [Bryobacteraceae bacterium]|nr:anti-sigma factor [Bryobacteraceae bacterium]
MNHPLELLNLAASGLLTSEEEHALRSHLDTCPPCRRELAVLETLTEGLRAVPMPMAPSGLAARTKARLAAACGAAEEQRLSGAILVFLVLFAWTLTALPWALGQSFGMSKTLLFWLLAWTAAGWVAGGAAVAVLIYGKRRHDWSLS